MSIWLACFVATCAIETAVLYRFVRVRRILIAQAITHPLVWLAMAYLPGDEMVRLCVVELAATLIEARIYRSFTLSAFANGASLLLVAIV